jgi:hypothetical protein
MMWHWNSLWAPAPGGPPAIDDPSLWQMPWSAEQAIALQARSWETMLSATHSWWTMVLAAWPLGAAWPAPAWGGAALERSTGTGTEVSTVKPSEPQADTAVAPAPAPARRAPARKRSTPARKR